MTVVLAFGQWLRQRRKACDLSQEELARRVNCGFETIRKIEAGLRRPSRELALLLAQELKVPPEEQAAIIEFARAASEAATSPVAVPGNAISAPPTLRHPGNLPLQRTPFVGRQRELALAQELLLHPAVRLVTLSGPPGVGKTRFGLQLAEIVKSEFRGGAFFVNLASLADPAGVAAAIVRALGLTESAAILPAELLKSHLSERQTLLLLDNFEQLIAAVPLLTDLIETCPDLKLLITSRGILSIYGEHQFPVPPLSLANPQTDQPEETAQVSEAVALFAARARAVRPLFAITAANAAVVARICRQLDGLPLCIELAAARIAVLTPAMLAAQLKQRLTLLTGGSRDLPPRQRTLRASVAWSYDLLNDKERGLFRRLGVFVGGFTLSAAAAVVSDGIPAPAPPHLAEETAILDLLQSLVDKSLIVAEDQAGEPRFHLLETLREFALEQLGSGENEQLRQRCVAYFLALVEDVARQPAEGAALRQASALAGEHDNLLAALEWSSGPSGDVLIGLRLANSLWHWWVAHGYLTEGRVCLLTLLLRNETHTVPDLRARALAAAGDLAHRLGDLNAARTHLGESRALYEQLGDKRCQTRILGQVAAVAQAQGDYVEARRCWSACRAWYEEAGNLPGCADAISGLAEVAAAAGDYAAARALQEESLQIHRHLNLWRRVALNLLNLGAVARIQGDYATAQALQTEALAQAQAHQDDWLTACTLCYMGELALAELDYRTAQRRAEESVAVFRAVQGATPMLLYATGILGRAGSSLGDHEAALKLLEERLLLARRTGGSYIIAPALYDLGLTALHAASYAQASARLREALALYTTQGHRWGITRCLAALGALAARLERPELAACLFGAAEELAIVIKAWLEPEFRLARDHSRALAEQHLAPGSWDAACAAGHQADLQTILELAQTLYSGSVEAAPYRAGATASTDAPEQEPIWRRLDISRVKE